MIGVKLKLGHFLRPTMLANAVKCFECWGRGSVRGVLSWLTCARCLGTGQLCADCHRPEGVCECVPTETCPTCGKTACRCRP